MADGPVSLDPARATGGTNHSHVDMQRLPRPVRVKNKAPAPMQITAEQILREAREMQESEGGPTVPKQNITDPEELAEYRMSKRKEFEDVIRRNRTAIGVWVKYAKWEESQRDFERARSVYERALDVEYQNHSLWLKYAEMEMRHRQINHARNIWDRATALLPRVDQFWYKYAFMEEMLGNVTGARQVFERWLEWMPDDNAYLAYVKMEIRYDEIDRCRNIFSRYVESHNSVRCVRSNASTADPAPTPIQFCSGWRGADTGCLCAGRGSAMRASKRSTARRESRAWCSNRGWTSWRRTRTTRPSSCPLQSLRSAARSGTGRG
jgi:tetratricopeptide (TPR) repeat protein